MRVSVQKNDPGYRDDAVAFTVTLDGVSLKDCITADEELGEVHRIIDDTLHIQQGAVRLYAPR